MVHESAHYHFYARNHGLNAKGKELRVRRRRKRGRGGRKAEGRRGRKEGMKERRKGEREGREGGKGGKHLQLPHRLECPLDSAIANVRYISNSA